MLLCIIEEYKKVGPLFFREKQKRKSLKRFLSTSLIVEFVDDDRFRYSRKSFKKIFVNKTLELSLIR